MKKGIGKISDLSTSKLVLYGFLLLILIGAFILMLPISSADGEWTRFIDALFTATTSVCVTGLVTVPTYLHWSVFGKVVIIILIQLGGLGVVCIMMGFMVLLGKRITLSGRKVIQESYNLDTSKGMVKLVISIIKTTFLIEGLGAVLLSVRFVQQFGLVKGIIYGVFHSISAFCNAGIDLIGDSSLMPYVDDVYVNVVIMLIIVSGGLGFIVWWELIDLIKTTVVNKSRIGKIAEKMTLNCKIVLLMTAFLLVSGFAIILLLEHDNPDTFGNMPMGNKVLAAAFQSVTLRTAGFCTVSQTGFKNATVIIMCMLMWIGGSPVGTAGGIKTTTIAILMIEVLSVVRGKKNAEIFRRRIAGDNVRTALSIVTVSILAIFVSVIVMSETETAPFRVILYEVASAAGTVGLSMDFTSSLTIIGKCIIIALMFMGRIGPVTMAMAFAARSRQVVERDLPERRIIIG